LGGIDLQKREICRETCTIAALFILGGNSEFVMLRRFLMEGNIAYGISIIFSGGLNLSET
jgi:hypothetical protein